MFSGQFRNGYWYSVLDVIRAFEKACRKSVPYELAVRGAGGVVACYADPSKASEFLGWKAVRTLDAKCSDTWSWQRANPVGFGE